MVRVHSHLQPVADLVGDDAPRTVTAGRLRSRHLRPRRPSRPVRRSILGTLVRLDDDPVLLCDCAEGAPHTCG